MVYSNKLLYSILIASVWFNSSYSSNNTAFGEMLNEQEQEQKAFLVRISLPIDDESERAARQTIQRYVERMADEFDPQVRPKLVLEFDTSNSRTGVGSDLLRCQSLARFLTSSELERFDTIAYVPEPQGFVDTNGVANERARSDLRGHAVLVALACNQLIMHKESTIGAATIDSKQIDEAVEFAYQFYVSKRRPIPPIVAMSMVKPQISLMRVTTGEGIKFVSEQEMEELSEQGKVVESETLSEDGALAVYSSDSLLKWRLIQHQVRNKRDLAIRLKVSPDQLISDMSLGVEWKAARIDLSGGIDKRTVDWMIREVRRHVQATETNLLLVNLDFTGGDSNEALRLSQSLAEFDPAKVRTVAFIPERASGATAIIALGCDQLIMGPDAVLGGPSTPSINQEQLTQLSVSLKELAEEKKRDWSVYVAVIDPRQELVTWRHRQTGEIRLLSLEHHAALQDSEEWLELRQVDMSEGIKADLAEQLAIVSYLANDFEQVKSIYRLTEEPYVLQPTLTEQWIERIAHELASPWIAGWLLFGAMFFISTEFSQPGTGVPGFLGTVCLLLFFWSQYLEGNAEWLEILLFAVGMCFIALEVFVLPGFGIFGVGGLIMVVVSIVLASQTFVLPSNQAQGQQLTSSLMMVVAAGLGFVVSFSLLRKYLPHLPVFKRLMLRPPTDDKTSFEDIATRESMVRWDHLVNQNGEAITALRPSGKVRIDSQIVDVITDGRTIDKGEAVVVTEVSGNRVVVQRLEE